MITKFLSEEKAQGAIEYILLVGGIIVAAITIFSIYGQMVRSAGERLNASTQNATAAMSNRIISEIANMDFT